MTRRQQEMTWPGKGTTPKSDCFREMGAREGDDGGVAEAAYRRGAQQMALTLDCWVRAGQSPTEIIAILDKARVILRTMRFGSGGKPKKIPFYWNEFDRQMLKAFPHLHDRWEAEWMGR